MSIRAKLRNKTGTARIFNITLDGVNILYSKVLNPYEEIFLTNQELLVVMGTPFDEGVFEILVNNAPLQPPP
ncbi:hypothetical protein RSW78_26090, partial [Escherichia coli]|uniref:hypothetical protein n=1 Tax=Escherichia coli TaxID=562 RepID=UPI0028DDD5EE